MAPAVNKVKSLSLVNYTTGTIHHHHHHHHHHRFCSFNIVSPWWKPNIQILSSKCISLHPIFQVETCWSYLWNFMSNCIYLTLELHNQNILYDSGNMVSLGRTSQVSNVTLHKLTRKIIWKERIKLFGNTYLRCLKLVAAKYM